MLIFQKKLRIKKDSAAKYQQAQIIHNDTRIATTFSYTKLTTAAGVLYDSASVCFT